MTRLLAGPGANGGLRQLLYTNTDRLVDGEHSRGWQVLARSESLDEHLSSRALTLIDPQLNPVTSLAGFPTPEEIAAAERRYAQIPTPDGTVLVHTAPAGTDRTGRPNTMNHVVMLPEQATAALATADLWRSPGWCTPYGVDQVRSSNLPQALPAGSVVDDDSVADFMAVPGRGAVLAALAQNVEEVLVRRACAPVDFTTTVLLVVESTDEAALWLGALQRTCAPMTGQRLGFSTLERVAGRGDLEAVLKSRIDVACVPRQDLESLRADEHGFVVIDPAQPQEEPTGSWARLVRAMAADLGAWVAGVEAVREILGLLDDHRDLTPGWPLAMAESCDPGLLGDGSVPPSGASGSPGAPGVDDAVDSELVACQPRAVEHSPYLVGVINDRVLGAHQSDPGHWYARLAMVGASSPVTELVSGLVRKYFESAVRSPRWLLDATRAVDERAHRCLARWSATAQGRRAVAGALAVAVDSIGSDPRETAPVMLVDRLMRDGVELPVPAVDRLLMPAACALLGGPGEGALRECLLQMQVGDRCRDALARLMEGLLRPPGAGAGRPPTRILPTVGPEAVTWLGPRALPAECPELAGDVAVLRLVSRPDPETAAQALAAMSAVTGPFELAAEASQALAAHARIDDLVEPAPQWGNRHSVLIPVLLRSAGSEAAARISRDLLIRGSHPEDFFWKGLYSRVSALTAAALVVLIRHAPLVSGDPCAARIYATNVILATRILEGTAGPRLDPAIAAARRKALAVLTLAVWNGLAVDLHGASQAEHDELDALEPLLAQDPGLLAAPGEDRLGALVGSAATAAFWVSCRDEAPDEAAASAEAALAFIGRAEAQSTPLLRGRQETVIAIVRAWTAHLGPEQHEHVRAALLQPLAAAPGAERWIDKTVLSARATDRLRRKLFGGR